MIRIDLTAGQAYALALALEYLATSDEPVELAEAGPEVQEALHAAAEER